MVFLFLKNNKEIFKFLLNYKVEVEKMRNNGKNYEEMIVNKLNNKKATTLPTKPIQYKVFNIMCC